MPATDSKSALGFARTQPARSTDQEELRPILTQILEAKELDQVLLDLTRPILTLFQAEKLIFYGVDAEKQEAFLRVPSLGEGHSLRCPLTEHNLSGLSCRQQRVLNVRDVYNPAELTSLHPQLTHDSSWDKKTGFRTKQVLTCPILVDPTTPIGVLQIINKRGGMPFTSRDEELLSEIGKNLAAVNAAAGGQSARPFRKYEYLLSNRLLSPQELEVAFSEVRKTNADLDSLILDKYKLQKADLGKALTQYYKAPFIEYDERFLIPTDLLKPLNIDYLKKNFWIPLKRDKTSVDVLLDDPHDQDKVHDIQRSFPGQTVRLSVGIRRDIAQFLKSATGEVEHPGLNESISDILGELVNEAQAEQEDVTVAGVDENDSAIVRLANQIIADAYRLGSSDIHIEPYSDRRETIVRFRVDGSCFEYMKIPPTYRRAIASRLKIMANLDIAERRKPQDGKIKYRLTNGREIELRVATIPTSGTSNEDVVMRILSASEPLPLEKMDFSERNLNELKRLTQKPYGIILCVGPTGSGKTTTLHACLGFINTPERKIWTAEDPVEITQFGLRQVQVHPKIGFTFATAMRAFLRADPDVIMVGEMRDKETADTGIEASLTGHLVFSTLHTNSAIETITRLLDMGCDSFSFGDAVLGILAQRLTKRICKECKESYHATEEEYRELVEGYGESRWEALGIAYSNEFLLYRGKGCDVCNKTGFRGRVPLHELMVGTDAIKRLIQNKAKTEDMVKLAMSEGMNTLVQDGIEKVLKGSTTFKQVKAVAIK
jgi:type II secretory ATPase GspE/PulE/Tfp pilus assembly ATPase PilB-like protein